LSLSFPSAPPFAISSPCTPPPGFSSFPSVAHASVSVHVVEAIRRDLPLLRISPRLQIVPPSAVKPSSSAAVKTEPVVGLYPAAAHPRRRTPEAAVEIAVFKPTRPESRIPADPNRRQS
uniref:Uncharacterized protein n=1 Tax=Cucumis melo TaxID=3656 RepID=A0A9I9E3C1_CUCME